MASVLDTGSTSIYSTGFTSFLETVQKEDLTCKKKLGSGGFGIVYRARHKYWDDVAVKVCKLSVSEETMKRVSREVERMVKASKHDYIVQIRGIIPKVDPRINCCIVMEYMEHGSLQSLQKRLKTFPHSVKIRMIYQVSLGMNYLHTQQPPIIHRDLKLENIFVGSGLRAKVGDLGLATWCTASNNKERGGTLTHIPPEMFKNINEKPEPKYDIYGFGITLWEFATGCQPYENCGGNSSLMESGVIRGQRPDCTKIPNNEPEIIKTLMEETWQQDPSKRPEFQVIKERIRKEYEKNYKSKFNEDQADIFLQLQLTEMPAKQEESDRFPWEQDTTADVTDSLPVSVTERGDRCFAVPSAQHENSDPKPLQSVPPVAMETEKPEDVGYPVVESNAQQERNVPGLMEILERVAGMGMGADAESRDAANLPTEPKPPTHHTGTVPSQPSDALPHAAEPHHSGPDHSTLGGSAPSAGTKEQRGPYSYPFATIDPNSHQGGNVQYIPFPQPLPHPCSQPYIQPPWYLYQQPQLYNPQPPSYPQHQQYAQPQPQPPNRHQPSSHSQTFSNPPAKPHQSQDNNANSISINVKGNRNVVTVAPRGNVINFSKPSKKGQKPNKKQPTPSPSSSSCSDCSEEGDTVVDSAVVAPSITSSKEPVTVKVIGEIDEYIARKYRKLGRALGLSNNHITNIEADHGSHGQQEVAYQIMLAWIKGNPSEKVTKSILAQALVDIGLHNVAEKL